MKLFNFIVSNYIRLIFVICYLLHFQKKKQEAAVYIQNLIAKFNSYTYAEANTPLNDKMYERHLYDTIRKAWNNLGKAMAPEPISMPQIVHRRRRHHQAVMPQRDLAFEYSPAAIQASGRVITRRVSMFQSRSNINNSSSSREGDNTWEPAEKFVLPHLVKPHHASLQSGKNVPKTSGNRNYLLKSHLSSDEEVKGWEPEKVLGINHLIDNEKFLVAKIKFKNNPEIKFVPASWVNVHCPQLVIALYESRISWRDKRLVVKFVAHHFFGYMYR